MSELFIALNIVVTSLFGLATTDSGQRVQTHAEQPALPVSQKLPPHR